MLGCYGALLVRGVNHVDEAKCTLGGGWVEAGDKGVGTGVGSSTMIWESIEFGGYVSRKLEVVLWRENICEAGSGRGGPGFEGLVVSFKEPVMVQGVNSWRAMPKRPRDARKDLKTGSESVQIRSTVWLNAL